MNFSKLIHINDFEKFKNSLTLKHKIYVDVMFEMPYRLNNQWYHKGVKFLLENGLTTKIEQLRIFVGTRYHVYLIFSDANDYKVCSKKYRYSELYDYKNEDDEIYYSD